MIDLRRGDCLELLKGLPDNSVDAVVTDPPAGIEFMGQAWDTFDARPETNLGYRDRNAWGETPDGKKNPYAREATPRYRGKTGASLLPFQDFICEVFTEIHRVLKPGGHLLVWAIPRTSHHTAMGIERAGFEIRDVVTHLFGSGFPKSLNVSKAIDTDDAARWQGWGTALKPASEHWILARKPLDGTVAANVLEYGTGALNIDGCRIGYADTKDREKLVAGVRAIKERGGSMKNSWKNSSDLSGANDAHTAGRWPANVTLDEEATAMLDEQSGITKSSGGKGAASMGGLGKKVLGKYALDRPAANLGGLGDTGGASRFFYVAKASKADKNANGTVENTHPTVKNTSLMRWLVRLITPPKGTVLDPFMGSGSTGVACIEEGFSFVGMEREENFFEIARKRIRYATLPVDQIQEKEED